MSDIGFLARYALRSLIRGGQRSLLAVVCIAFGVLSLVALQQLAHVVGAATNVEPRLKLGGDLSLAAETGALRDTDIAALESLRADGVLRSYTVMARGETALLRSTASGLVQFVGRSLAVDPQSYPLLGTIRLRNGSALSDALAAPGHVVITRDLALRLHVQRGDTLRYGGALQKPATLVVGGIADVMPDRRGQTLLYDFATAAQLADSPPLRWAAALADDDSAAAIALRARGFGVTRAATEPADRTTRLFGTMLRGAGLLGLIIGGVGIAYTLQVMLTRRRLEIATLRAIGYRTSRLLLLFGLEAAALGALGGIIGAVLALALSAQLVHLLDRTAGALMLEYAVAWRYVAAGPIVGIVTAVLFGMAAILRASAVRPAVLLRDMQVRAPRAAALGGAALHVGIALAFTLMAAAVMGSLPAGAAVIALSVIGSILLGGVLMGLLWLVVRLPLPRLPLLNMARANLRSRQVRSAFSLIALFVGTFAIGFAATAMLSGSARVAERRGSDEGLNLRVFVGAADSLQAPRVLRELGAVRIVNTGTLDLVVQRSNGQHVSMLGTGDVLDGDAIGALVTLHDADEWRGGAGQALVPRFVTRAPFGVAVGDSLDVQASGGGRAWLHVVGAYEGAEGDVFAAPRGLVIGSEAASRLNAQPAPALLAELDPAALERAAPLLGQRLPASVVLSRREMNDFLVSSYRSLFTFVVAVAALALLAGAVLIANAVALAMVERRRELGVLMAVGYTSRRVLRTILLENAALGLVAGVAGVAAVRIVGAVLNARQPGIDLQLGAGPALLLVLNSMLLAMLAAGLVAWKPVHVRPLEVLRDE
jgi:putative ABC transport system permease protein